MQFSLIGRHLFYLIKHGGQEFSTTLNERKNSACSHHSPMTCVSVALEQHGAWLHLCVCSCLAVLQLLSLFYDSHSKGHCVHKTTWPRKHQILNNKESPVWKQYDTDTLKALKWLAFFTMLRDQVTGLNGWVHAVQSCLWP